MFGTFLCGFLSTEIIFHLLCLKILHFYICVIQKNEGTYVFIKWRRKVIDNESYDAFNAKKMGKKSVNKKLENEKVVASAFNFYKRGQ